MGSYSAAWEDRLSELADYRNINGTAMFLQLQRKRCWLSQVNPKDSILQPGRKEIVYDLSRIQELKV
jgi:hypothetical protein